MDSPKRTNYFDGRFLTAADLTLEQDYHRSARHAHNGGLHGTGVVCGLDVRSAGDGVVVEPGIAVDPRGREIVVPSPGEMPDPRQPIDDRGEATGEPVDSDEVTICLVHSERPEGEGDPPPYVRQTYRLDVRPGRPDPAVRGRAAKAARGGSPDELADALCRSTGADCEGDEDECVELATVTIRGKELEVDPCVRRAAISTGQLLELVQALVERIHALEQER